ASYYYSIPRLTTAGTVTVDHRDLKVTGSSWLDREWSTSALGSDQAGWDWFALQLEDGSDLMFYRLRRKDGSVDPHSAGSLLEPDGKVVRLNRSDVKVTVRSHWRSPRGGTYPSRWHLSVPKLHLDLDVTPLLADQELDLSVRYWEGAVKVTGSRRDKAVQGVGYVELTGY
ncbi:MAG TPA: lipocalin family protein, partial [Gammaproteobacteria bacterium]|nr:lipocalin family protein [Gammaproteobacteria bacterium]